MEGTIADRIAFVMKLKSVEQSDLCAFWDVKIDAVKSYFRNKKRVEISNDKLVKFALAHQVDLNWLMAGIGNGPFLTENQPGRIATGSAINDVYEEINELKKRVKQLESLNQINLKIN